ncbi:Hemerythrin HHE cation binding domain-containing protein [Nitrosomonas ureae]|uniref:Hemerythrin HHE cation binding domain-containing protein n=1 Tax=Nitrosomonas ureae TaxID=44577 RepID=A0A285C1L5_9PROT|nr:hemerythrin domain-containing protein [Nitrosomonas ureae]SNX61369.1 Hemerythrin HHE cation binding domain-containing protein [Nitrosomonas ureae]
MPRAGALVPLSREHHSSLVTARAARKAAESNDMATCLAAVQHIEAHWQDVLVTHFAQEEALLQFAKDTLEPEIITRILTDHEELRSLACESCTLDPAMRLRRFGDLLAAHVRYEERVLFPQLQSHPAMIFAAEKSIQSIPRGKNGEFS